MTKYEYGENALKFMKDMDFERVAGTQGDKQGADMIAGYLSDMNAIVYKEEYAIDRYEIHSAKLASISPEYREYKVTGYGLAESTGEGGLRAPLLYAENANEILLSKAKGKIVLLNEHPNMKTYRIMTEVGAAGFISISGLVTDEEDKTDLELRALRKSSHRNGHLCNGVTKKLPGVTIRAADAAKLLESRTDEVELTLVQTDKEAKSWNIITQLEGTDKKDEYIVFGAHYDTVPFSHGMYDNASGSAAVLEAYRYYKENRPRRSLKFIWFGTEEQGFRGSLHHMQVNPEEKETVKLMINLDLGGQVIGSYHAIVTADDKFCSIMEYIAKEAGFGLSVTQDIYSSDSEAYADNGIPAISFYRTGVAGHSRYDAINLISERVMDDSIRFIIHFSEKLINSEVFPVSQTIPDNLKEKLDAFWGRK